MKSALIAPRKYIQGRGVLKETGNYVAMLGRKPLVLWDSCVKDLVGADRARQPRRRPGWRWSTSTFSGESTKAEAEPRGPDRQASRGPTSPSASAAARSSTRPRRPPSYAGIKHGHRAHDRLERLAHQRRHGLVRRRRATASASTAGRSTRTSCWSTAQVIASGPVRAFVAGMGDALSTWVEAEAAYKSRAVEPGRRRVHHGRHGHRPAVLRHAHGVRRRGQAGGRAARCVTPAVEKVIEANVLLSGLGFESGGLATAHMIANALPSFPECKKFMHGEKVGFGIISQLCLDDEMDDRRDVRDRRFRDRHRPAGDVRRPEPRRRRAATG